MSERVGLNPAPLSPEQAAAFVRGRRSVSRFLPEPPPVAVVEQAVEAARWAPNHKLTQPWRFYRLGPKTTDAVVQLNAERVAAAKGPEAGEAKRRRWAAVPGWLTVTCARDDDPITAREDYAACCCAVQNLMLVLWSAGVASKWTTGDVTRDPEFYRLLGIDPTTEDVVALLWYGYPDAAPRMRRKPVAQILSELP